MRGIVGVALASVKPSLFVDLRTRTLPRRARPNQQRRAAEVDDLFKLH
jgi:hypothetical protein